jgi:hypothetical protein
LETVQSIYEAFGRGDIPAILNPLSDDVQWERPGTGHGVPWLTSGSGKAHVGGFFQSLAGIENHPGSNPGRSSPEETRSARRSRLL